MCLIHDLGEIYDGDIPGFEKKSSHKMMEEKAVEKVVRPLSNKAQQKIIALWREFNNCQTQEAQLAKALDKLEALIQHNEADISTWIPLEYGVNLTYGQEYCEYHNFIKIFRKTVDEMTKDKISRDST